MVVDISLISFCISFIIFSLSTFSLSYLSNFLDINVTVLFNSSRSCSPLIWLSLVSSVLQKISTTCFFTFFIQLNKMGTQSGVDYPADKTSSTLCESFRLTSRWFFFGSSPFVELSVSSLFFITSSKIFL